MAKRKMYRPDMLPNTQKIENDQKAAARRKRKRKSKMPPTKTPDGKPIGIKQRIAMCVTIEQLEKLLDHFERFSNASPKTQRQVAQAALERIQALVEQQLDKIIREQKAVNDGKQP